MLAERRCRGGPRQLALAAVVSALGCNQLPEKGEGDVWHAPQGNWAEVWRDDFDGPAGSAPDVSKWTLEIRPHGQNGEQDYDTDSRQNSFLDGNGNLALRAVQERFVDAMGHTSDQPFTSARLDTKGKLEQAYGRFEARMQLPRGGRGVWPAFWLLGSNVGEAGWPECGEVDIIEMAGSRPNQISGSLHGPGYSGGNAFTRSFALNADAFGDGFHVFALEWTPDGMRWLVDEKPFHVRTASGVADAGRDWVFDHAFYLIINLAIGGQFDGDPDASTSFPQQMLIDYVRVSRYEPG